MTKCPKCKFYNICKGRINETVENCVRFKSTEQTNEEWRKTCSAEEFAEWLEEICFREQYNDGESMSGWYEKHDEKYWEMWLKQPHRKESKQ